jgi:hypothetical protein
MLPRPNVVLVAQAVRDGLATASFDAASPHHPWSVGSLSIAAKDAAARFPQKACAAATTSEPAATTAIPPTDLG